LYLGVEDPTRFQVRIRNSHSNGGVGPHNIVKDTYINMTLRSQQLETCNECERIGQNQDSTQVPDLKHLQSLTAIFKITCPAAHPKAAVISGSYNGKEVASPEESMRRSPAVRVFQGLKDLIGVRASS